MVSHKKGYSVILLALTCILLLSSIASGQSSGFQVKIDQVSTNTFPDINLHLSILNTQGFPITTLSSDDVTVKEDGKVVEDISLSSYTNDEEPLAVVILIDTSGSMKPVSNQDPLANAIEAASSLIDQLKPHDHVAVISFADEVTLLQDLTTNKSLITSVLQTLSADGATAMNDAIVQALNLLNNRSERRAILLITDGKPEGDQDYSYETALNLAAVRSIPIYPIGFGDVDKTQLRKLAELSGGIEQIKPDSQELEDALGSILALFREQYYLTYTSQAEADGTSHEIEILVNYQGESQSAFINYLARKPILIGINQPAEGSIVVGQVEIQISVDAFNPISQVDVYIDDQLVQTFSEPPYTISWDTDEYVPGEHSIRVIAKDALGFEDEKILNCAVELQQKEWIYWFIGIACLAALAIIIPLVLRSRGGKKRGLIRKAILIESDGLQPGHEWLLDKNIIRLGRKLDDNDIRLKGIEASRNHALIERSKRGFCIRSQKPENPVIVNGEKVDQRILQEGDMIQMGESTFRFEYRN
jgi:VWFA-related protein